MITITKTIPMVLLFLLSTFGYSQIGIGTTSPDPTSVLHVESTTQGFLTPRMTTAQRTAITTPANGLMVYDTTLASFYYYDTPTTAWIKINSGKDGRLKYKLIKSTDVLATVLAAEKTAGSNTKYLLDSATLYEINGTISVDLPIELNNAYIVGEDSSEDKLVKATGDLFIGTTGGSMRILTLQATAGNVFNITGTGSIVGGTQTQSMIVRDCIVSTSANVGKMENFALVFISIVQYINNTTGIIYKDISRLLLSNAGWFSSNSGTYETLQGTFGLVAKQGGFSEVTGTKIGFDVSGNPTITGDAVMETVVFTGTLTSGKYVNPYTVGTYTGFNFNNSWSVRCTGIPNEGDSQSTGTVYLDRTGTAQVQTPIGTLNVGAKLAINAGLNSNLYRATSAQTNRITYSGKKGRVFQVNCSISFGNATGLTNTEYAFYIMRIPSAGGTDPQISTETLIDTNAGYIQSFPVQGSVYLNTGDSIELWVKRLNQGTGTTAQSFLVRSFNMSIK
ncbi:hypothetical protein MH928_14030 [Flavobacterium sp. WW92]|uniref:hypothetical protein n=1 Tax=unclassified Flavobacterium TaxID=196869 RepID=UPI002224A28B|nr:MULTISPECIES: hypothetical protein [unclassified Flavobacterium]WDO12437.1 hypothetical protein MH928_14030 [Flavobacterium sp. WW92]